MWTRKTTELAGGRIVEEYHTARYGAPGQKREKKKRASPEQVRRQNQWVKEKKAWMRMLQYFRPNDYFITLTYRKEARPPDMAAAKKDVSNAIARLRKEYKKRGGTLRWMRNIEVGSRGGWHVHLLVNRIPDTDILVREAWPHGKAVWQLTYERGGFRELAAYITKMPDTDSRLREADFCSSRNMPLPEAKKQVMRRKTWKEEIRPPKGYVLEKESLREGINGVTGYPYRTYLLVRVKGGTNGKTESDGLHRNQHTRARNKDGPLHIPVGDAAGGAAGDADRLRDGDGQ